MAVKILMTVSTDVIAAIILLFLLDLLSHNTVMSEQKNRSYTLLAFLALMLTLCDITSTVMELVGNPANNMLDLVLVTANYILMPWTALMLTFIIDDKIKRLGRGLIAMNVCYTLLCLANINTGWFFTITSGDVYSRGKAFLVTPLFCAIFAFLAFFAILRAAVKDDIKRRVFLIGISVNMFAMILLQMKFYGLLLICPGIAMTLLLYYVYLREREFTYDPLTGVKNRRMFNEMMIELENDDNVAIVMFDVNDLKYVNDTFGHSEGDNYLTRASQLMEECFGNVGNVYRIGGDEFAAICAECVEKRLQVAGECFSLMCSGENHPYRFSIAWNFAIKNSGDTNIFSVLARADALMYETKKKDKLRHSRD